MGELKLTKTRLELLRAVRARDVNRYDWDHWQPSIWQSGLGGRGLKVTDRINSMRIAGWVRAPEFVGSPRVVKWELTEAGRKLLEEAERRG